MKQSCKQTNKQKSNLNQIELLDPIEKSEEHGKHRPRLLPHTIHKNSKGIIKLNTRAKISKHVRKQGENVFDQGWQRFFRYDPPKSTNNKRKNQ